MPTWQKVIYAILMLGLAFFIYYSIKSNPNWFSKEKFMKSSYVMAVLALALIAFIGLLVFSLRH